MWIFGKSVRLVLIFGKTIRRLWIIGEGVGRAMLPDCMMSSEWEVPHTVIGPPSMVVFKPPWGARGTSRAVVVVEAVVWGMGMGRLVPANHFLAPLCVVQEREVVALM